MNKFGDPLVKHTRSAVHIRCFVLRRPLDGTGGFVFYARVQTDIVLPTPLEEHHCELLVGYRDTDRNKTIQSVHSPNVGAVDSCPTWYARLDTSED